MKPRVSETHPREGLAARRAGGPGVPAHVEQSAADIVAPSTDEAPSAALFAEYPELMKAEHVAEILSTSKAAVYRMIREHQLPVVQIGPKYVYVPKRKFVAMINAANE